MRPEELQIGDIITYLDGTICKVREIREDTISVSWIDKDSKDWYTSPMSATLFNPVGLTSEILEKNGFTGGEYKSYTGDVWYLEEEGFRKIGLTMSRKESTLWGEKIKPLSPDSIGYNFAVPNIKFVHELQHALRLCGINKKIEI